MSSDVSPETSVEDLLARLERERLAADRLYNDALTRVDHALQSMPVLPAPPAPADLSRLADVNGAWDILATPPVFDRSWRGRLQQLIWRLVGPPLDAQRRFNATLVDHLNRTARAQQETAPALAAVIEILDRELAALVRFESLLIQSLQTITVYVDSKDRSLGGAEIRQRLALTEQRVLALKRSVEAAQRALAAPASVALPPSPGLPPAVATPPSAPDSSPAADAEALFAGAVDAVTYVAFEDRFRGAREEIGRRVADYVPILAEGTDIVDIGCGRGELLALLAARGVRARGVDVNAAMVEACRRRGLVADEGDALGFLERQPDASIGGLIAVQVVEHFAPAYLMHFLQAAFHKLRPGAPLILETINPSCWMAFFETYLRDPTHKQAIHAETLKYLVEASGFTGADVQYRAPVAADDRLVTVALDDPALAAVAGLADALNDHADKLNRRLFSYMDYVVVARR